MKKIVGLLAILILASSVAAQDSTYLDACGTLNTSFLDCPRVILFSEPMPLVTEIVAVNPSGFQHGDTVRFTGWYHPYVMDMICFANNPAATHTLSSCSCCQGSTGDVNCDGSFDVGDLNRMLDYMFDSRAPLCCFGQGDIIGDGRIDADDLNEMIQVLFIVFRPMPPCDNEGAISADTGASWEIALDGTEWMYPTCPLQDTTSQIICGVPATFHIRYRNLSGENYQITNAFRIYSPDGANWSTLESHGNVVFPGSGQKLRVDTTGLLDRSLFPTYWEMECFGCDGYDSDTVAFHAFGNSMEQGLPAGFDNRVFSIRITVPLDQNLVGKHVCLDSVTNYPTSNIWRWAQLSNQGMDAATPLWGGPYCFEIAWPPPNLLPPIGNCPTAIEGDHCQQFLYDFSSYDPDGDPVWYRLESGPGSIDSTTGVWTANLPGTGEYMLTVRARDFCDWGTPCTILIRGVNTVLVSCKSSTPTSIAHVGELSSQLPEVTNDCDPLTFVLDSTGGVSGALSIDPGSGELSYTPDPADLLLPSPIRMRVTVSDGVGSDIWVPTWLIERPCTGTTGNVDCSIGDVVDVGDLTALIDNLFINFTTLCSPGEANCDGQGTVDVGDLTALIDNLFINFTPLPACP